MTGDAMFQVVDLIFCLASYLSNLVVNFSKAFLAYPGGITFKFVKHCGWEPSSATSGRGQCWKQDTWQK